MLNDEAFFEAARALAARTLAESASTRRPERARAGKGSSVATRFASARRERQRDIETARIVRRYERATQRTTAREPATPRKC